MREFIDHECNWVGCGLRATKQITERIPSSNVMYYCTKHAEQYNDELKTRLWVYVAWNNGYII